MNLVVTLEHRFSRTPDGKVWTKTTFGHSFWERYLEVFETVRIVARALDVKNISDNWEQVNDKRVLFTAVPYYIGPLQYMLRYQKVIKVLKDVVHKGDAVIMRVPSQIANILTSILEKRGHLFALEVVGDPYDVFAPGSMKHPLRPFFRYRFSHQLKKQCAKAFAIAYVTQYSLQRRYPPALDTFVTHFSSVDIQKTQNPFRTLGEVPLLTYYSDVELNRDTFSTVMREFNWKNRKIFNIITVASLEQMYKGIDTLIDSIAIIVRNGFDLRLNIIGDGKHRKELESRVNKLGLSGQISFLGQIPSGGPIFAQLDQADLFVLPSRAEGMPRAMIEAMARGLPCIGSTVGGIPELLHPEDLVPPGDAKSLANKIHEVLSDPVRMRRMSERNFQKAKEYRDDVLHQRRLEFYRYVRQQTENWLKSSEFK